MIRVNLALQSVQENQYRANGTRVSWVRANIRISLITATVVDLTGSTGTAGSISYTEPVSVETAASDLAQTSCFPCSDKPARYKNATRDQRPGTDHLRFGNRNRRLGSVRHCPAGVRGCDLVDRRRMSEPDAAHFAINGQTYRASPKKAKGSAASARQRAE
jgi:hypothetical protein